MDKTLDLSIVIPVFNEQESVRLLYEKICRTCKPLRQTYEILFVDDGSRDETFRVLESLHRQDSQVRVVRFRKNYGQTAALAAGFREARGRIVVSMDGDLQNDPADIPRLLSCLEEGYDVVCGWRKDRKDKLISRRVPSRIANWLISKITGVSIHDNGCSLKAYRAEVIKRVALYSEMHRFIPAMSTLTGARIAEVVVTHHPRQYGKSKYGLSRTWRVFLDLFLITMLTGFASRPAIWFGMLSLPALIVGSVGLIDMVFSNNSGIVLPTTTFLSFSLAGYLIVLGVLGEMVFEFGDFHPERMFGRMKTRAPANRAQ